MANQTTVEQVDAIVIGAGQAGGPLSTALAKAGHKTVIIEREHVGGTCVNEGCTPTKTMVASARVAHLARRGADYGVQTGPIAIDMTKIRQRKRDIVDSFRGGSEHGIASQPGVELIMGEGRFIDAKTVEVALNAGGTRQISANWIFLNVGARPSAPTGYEAVLTLNSTSIMELDSVPEHLLVIGGSYIALEFGQMFRRFGSQVSIIERGAHLLSREDADVSDAVAEIMRQEGIEVLLNTTVKHAGQTDDGHIRLTIESSNAGELALTGSHLLLAVGRTSNADRLNLEAAGVAVDSHGFIVVNDRLETNVPGIYALGDVKGGPAFTHISYDDFRIIRTNLIEHGEASIKDRLVPYTVFIDPQLGRVGLSEDEARQQGRAYKVAKMPMSYVARALETDETRGFMKAVVDPDTKQILGCAILGIEGGEIMSVLQMAMMGKITYTTIADAVFAHPTLSESLNNLFTGLDG